MQQHETIRRMKEQLLRSINATENAAANDSKVALGSVRKLYAQISIELIALRRKGLYQFSKQKLYDDEVIREMEHNLDLEEARFNG